MAMSCAPPGQASGDPLTIGELSGMIRSGETWASGYLADATTTVKFNGSLSRSDMEVLLGSLAPFDPEVQPTEVEGLG